MPTDAKINKGLEIEDGMFALRPAPTPIASIRPEPYSRGLSPYGHLSCFTDLESPHAAHPTDGVCGRR